MTKNPHLVYIDDYEDSDDDEVFADKPIHITPRKSCEKYVLCDKWIVHHMFSLRIGSKFDENWKACGGEQKRILENLTFKRGIKIKPFKPGPF